MNYNRIVPYGNKNKKIVIAEQRVEKEQSFTDIRIKLDGSIKINFSN